MSLAGSGAPIVVAIGGGKGGTGKTLVAANISVFLATIGKKVLAIDASFGSPNLHTFLGVSRPARALSDMLSNNRVPLDHVAIDTGLSGLQLVSGAGDPAWAANPKSAQVNRLISCLRQVDADYVVLDLGAGTSGPLLDLFLDADHQVLVICPEPTSLELAYRVLRAAFVRRLRKIGLGAVTDIPVEELRMYEGGVPGPSDFYHRVVDTDPALAARIAAEMALLRPRFIVNEVRSKADSELGRDVANALRRRFRIPADELGSVEYDEAVSVSVRRRRPLLVEHPESRVARGLERVTRRLMTAMANDRIEPLGSSSYDLFEIEPSATEEEIRRASRRIREIYARDSIIVGSLYNKTRLDDLHMEIDAAYERLMDPTTRRAHDQELFPAGVPARVSAEDSDRSGVPVEVEGQPSGAAEARPRPAPPELAPDTKFTGTLMREIRESMGVELRAIASRTKIGVGYLQAIEEEAFHKLPAVVYVRGFLVQYARELRLDETRVLETYLERYRVERHEEA